MILYICLIQYMHRLISKAHSLLWIRSIVLTLAARESQARVLIDLQALSCSQELKPQPSNSPPPPPAFSVKLWTRKARLRRFVVRLQEFRKHAPSQTSAMRSIPPHNTSTSIIVFRTARHEH